MLKHLHRLFSYDHWANREVLAALKRIGSPPEKSLHWFAHTLAADLRANGHEPPYTDFIEAVWRGHVA